MNYRDLYPKALTVPSPGYNKGFKPVEVEVTPNLFYVDRYYPCAVCNIVTPFRDYTNELSIPVCSEECKAQSSIWQEESEKLPIPNEESLLP